jgi:hypothetical protein
MAQAVFGFDEQLERVSEIDVVVVRCFPRSFFECGVFALFLLLRSVPFSLVRTLWLIDLCC